MHPPPSSISPRENLLALACQEYGPHGQDGSFLTGLRRRVNWISVLIVCSVFTAMGSERAVGQEANSGPFAPVNPHASEEAKTLLRFLSSLSGKRTLTGQHNTPSQIDHWSNRAYKLTGKYPAIYGQDFGFSAGSDKDSVVAREAVIEEIKDQYRNGAIITLTWHAVRPTEDEPQTFRESVQGKLSDFEWQELLTPGTRLYQRWCAQVDEIAGYLKQLRDAGIPVLFRPYHEINGNWFWWNGRPGPKGSAALYRQLYDRYVNLHQLNNLLWVWNTGGPSQAEPLGPNYYPGHEYVDMLSIDIYGEYPQASYDYLLALGGGRPIALGEVGGVPSLEVLNRQPKWVYFLVWSEYIDFYNPLERLTAVFNDPRQINRGDPVLAEPMAAVRALRIQKNEGPPANQPVTPNASKEAKALLARLGALSGQSTLSGQDYGSKEGAVSVEVVARELGKKPAIYGADLALAPIAGAIPTERRKAMVEEAKRQAKAGAVISLTWRAPRPTEEDGAITEKSAREGLTDFEWSELLTPGTRLHQRWTKQVDEIAAALKPLQETGVAVLWRPYPESNAKKFWWGGRKGVRGSSELYRMLFERLAVHHRLDNLIWVWVGAPDLRSEVPGTAFHDYFPGLLFVDALAVALEVGERGAGGPGGRTPLDRILARAAVGKPIGIEAPSRLFSAESLARQPNYSWFILSPLEPKTEETDSFASVRTLYASSRVLSLPVEKK